VVSQLRRDRERGSRENQHQPPAASVFVERVTADNHEVAEGGRIVAGSNLEIHYTALSLISPERVRFRYLLEGFDDEWVDAGTRRVAYFTNLPPGPYRFRVVACNNDGVWNLEGASFASSCRPGFTRPPGSICCAAWRSPGSPRRCTAGGARPARAGEMAAERVEERTAALRIEVQERKRAEEAAKQANESLANAERHYRRIFNGVSDAVFVSTLREDGSPGRFIQANDQACRYLGYSRDELLQMGPHDLAAPEMRDRIKPSGAPSRRRPGLFETIYMPRTGSEFPWRSTLTYSTSKERRRFCRPFGIFPNARRLKLKRRSSKENCARLRNWRVWGDWPAAWRTILTTCSRSSTGTAASSSTACTLPIRCASLRKPLAMPGSARQSHQAVAGVQPQTGHRAETVEPE